MLVAIVRFAARWSGNGSYGLAITIGGVPIGATERVFFRGTSTVSHNIAWNTTQQRA